MAKWKNGSAHKGTRTLARRGGAEAAGAGDGGDEQVIERAIHALKRIVVGGQAEIMIESGDYLIDHVYGGAEEARSRSRRREASMRGIAARSGEFGLTRVGVWRCVRVAINARIIGQKVSLQLGQAQHLALTRLRDPAEIKMMAETAAEEGWSGKELRKKVAELKKPHAGGRLPEPSAKLFVARLDRLAEEFDFDSIAAEGSRLTPADVRHLIARTREHEALLARIRKALSSSAKASR